MTKRFVMIPKHSRILGSDVVANASGAPERVVTVKRPGALGTVEISVPVELASMLAAAFAGRPTSPPELTDAVPPLRYRIECGDVIGTDLVVDVPHDVVEPADVATWLAGRLHELARPHVVMPRRTDWSVSVAGAGEDAADSWASLSIDGAPATRWPLITVSSRSTGGAR